MADDTAGPDVSHSWNGRGDLRGTIGKSRFGPLDVLRGSHDYARPPSRAMVRAIYYRATALGVVGGAGASAIVLGIFRALGQG